MEQESRNSGLREAMQDRSMLSEHDPSELKAYDLISQTLAGLLEPGERVLAYADRDLKGEQADALAYDIRVAAEQPDVMGYQHGEPNAETDAFAYDEDAGRAEPDVMGYRHGEPTGQTDAFAYKRAPASPENDAFMSPVKVPAADVDFLVLTDKRLIRGFLENEKIMVVETTSYDEPQVQVVAESYLAVRLPPALCGLGEGDWWCWPAPQGTEPQHVIKEWAKGSE
jgi:hypothetical protein